MKGFVISWFYPPINSSEGLVTFKLLSRSKIAHDIYTQKDNGTWSYNKNEKSLVSAHLKTIFGKSKSFGEWSSSCVEYFDEHHDEYDFIMSRSMPPDSHVAALAIKKSYPSIKWVASFGDPIYDSPFTKIVSNAFVADGDFPRLPNPRYFAALLKRQAKKQLWYYQGRHDRKDELAKKELEYSTLTMADIVIFNNPYQREFMLSRHGLKDSPKYVTIPHPFETSLYKKHSKKDTRDRIVISHIGHLDLIRTPINLIKAVSRIKEKRPDIYNKLSVNFYGTLDSESKVRVVDDSLFESIHAHKPVSYTESLSIMQESDWCLLVDANISSYYEKNIFFAAKIADYIGSKTPILAISMIEGASADIMRKTGNILTSHSVDEIYMTLIMIVEGKITHQTYEKEWPKYDARSTAKTYDEIIFGLTK